MGNLCHKEAAAQPTADIPVSSTDASMKPSAINSQPSQPQKPSSAGSSVFKNSPLKEVETVVAKEAEPKPAAPPQEKPVKLDPKDFMFVKRENETLVRAPGQIKGQQFIIDDCKNCDIYLLDNSATISIDDCSNCRIFIGPCESSVFIRNCNDVKVVVACQQLRLRDCHGVDMLIYISAGQPSIETSDRIRIGCFDFSYFSLRSQFEASGLPVWNSEWSNVHDFNLTSGEPHWEFLPEDVKWSDLIKPPHEHCPAISAEETAMDSAVPVTWGKRPKFAQESCFVACFGPNVDAGFDLLSALKQKLSARDLYVMRTRQSKLRPAEATSLFNKDKKLIDLVGKASGNMVGLEFQGEDSNKIVAAAVKSLSSGSFHVSSDANVGLQMTHTYFEQLRPSI